MEILEDLSKKRFWRHFLTSSFVFLGVISTILQLINVIVPDVVFFQGLSTLLWVLLISAIVGIFKSWPRPITQEFDAPKTKISVVEGDILKAETHLVIGTNDTFDTETPIIISKNSLQGQALEVLYGGDLKELNKDLDKALSKKEVIGKIQKDGKKSRYEIGTIATIKHKTRLLFFLAYSELDVNNACKSSPDKIWKSLLALWDEVSIKSNGGVLSIPVIGGGQAKVSSVLPAHDAIRLIILSFMFASRGSKICDELRIVVTPKDFKKIDRLELQSFLASMRSS